MYWSIVCLSRVYAGVHTFKDIIAGSCVGFICLLLLHLFGDIIEMHLYGSYYGIYTLTFLLLLFLFKFPRATPWSVCYATTAQVFG